MAGQYFNPWDERLELSRIAVDVGAFCVALAILRTLGKFAAMLPRWRADVG